MVRNKPITYFFFILILLFSPDIFGQVNRYMVHLTDKEGTAHSLDNPETFLSQRAIDRRQKQNIIIIEQDLPITDSYLNGIKDTGAEVYFTSKWFNAVLVQCSESLISQIELLPYVSETEYVGPGAKIMSGSVKNDLAEDEDGKNYSGRMRRTRQAKQDASEFQNNLIGVDVLHKSGITGEGVIIAVMDGGFYGLEDIDPFNHLFDQNKILYTYDFVEGQPNVYLYSNHGTKVLSLLGAYDEGEFIGTAYDADYMLFVTEDDCGNCEHRVEEYNWAFAAELADSAGADVINTSLGYNIFEDPSMSYSQSQMDGKTAIISLASDIAFSKGMIVVASAGNEGNNGWGIVTAPGDAVNVISVGNITSEGGPSPSSSRGPTADGRIKPDLVALGSSVQVISTSGNIVSGSGTSFSSPQVAGLAALIWQAYPELSAEDIRYLLMETASNSASPNNDIGNGIPNFNSLNNYLTFADSDQNFLVYPNPLQSNNFVIRVNDPAEVPSLNVQVFNMSGDKMFEKEMIFTWQNNTQLIELINLPSGIYVVNLSNGNSVEKLRLVKI